jgi:hypothetical protein
MSYVPVTNKVDVYRLTRAGDSESYGSLPIVTSLDCNITPASTEIMAVYPGESAYSLYEIYTERNVDLKNGDKLKDSTGEYIIRGVPQVINNRFLYFQKIVGEKVV